MGRKPKRKKLLGDLRLKGIINTYKKYCVLR